MPFIVKERGFPMAITNTMRFCTDSFGVTDESGSTAPFNKQALLISKVPLDCTGKSEVTRFSIAGAEPTGTKRRIIFQIDGKYYRFLNGNLSEFTYEFNRANVLRYGNSVAGLLELENITAFLNKKVYPIIALEAPSTADDMPSIRMTLYTKVSNDVLTKTEESLVYEIATSDKMPTITEITAETALTGGGSVDIKVRLRGSDETWGDYMALASAANKQAGAVQFKFTYKVTTADGSDSAAVNSITINHTTGKAIVVGDNADLYSVVANYEVPLQLCYVVVHHEPLQDAYIDAYVNFMKAPKHRELIQIGTATGSRQELVLGVDGVADTGILTSSIRLYADGNPLTNFSYNSEVSTVVLSAKRNAVLYASYDYDHDSEVWRKMTKDAAQPYNDAEGTYMSRYTYQLPDSDATGKVIANVRLNLVKRTGTASNTKIGVGTGKKQMFALQHKYKSSTIKFNPTCDWTFEEASKILTVVAAKNSNIVISGKWEGIAPVVRSFAAGFAVA